jgi:hypothetical protein
MRAGLVKAAGVAVMALAACVLGGCEGQGWNLNWFDKGEDKPTTENRLRLDKAPEYAEAARQFNRSIDYLDRVQARANLLLTYYDEEGNERHEDPEGRLQIIRPNKLAVSLGKAGQVLFWFGCDPEQYWWLDLSDKSKRLAAIGRHDLFDDATAQRIGMPIKPLDLIRLLGVVKMDVTVRGATQWSDDGRQLGISSPIGDRGFQRVWVEPSTMLVHTIEIFDRQRNPVLVSEHTGTEFVEITRDIPGLKVGQVRMPSRVEITHLETKAKVRVTLTGVKDGPVSEKAFDLPTLLDKYPVDKTIDLDAKKKPAAAAGAAR